MLPSVNVASFIADVSLTSTWDEAKELIKDDPRYERFGRDDRFGVSRDWHGYIVIGCSDRGEEYVRHMEVRVEQAKVDFRKLLVETKYVSYLQFRC